MARITQETRALREAAKARRKEARRVARERAGLEPKDVAKHLRRSVAYIQQIERNGRATPYLAVRLSRLYSCPVELFIL